MDRLKDLWSGQDLINRIILISGLLVAVWCIVMGVGLYGLVVVVIMAFLMISRANHLTRRRGRLYGTLYFTMPDGEIVPRTFEQVKTEYVHGAQSQYAGRKVFLCFPWWRITSDGQCDTGFGLFIRLRSNNELAAETDRIITISDGNIIGDTGDIAEYKPVHSEQTPNELTAEKEAGE